MIVGAATVLIWHSFAWWGLYEILPGFIFSLIAIIVVSLLDTPPAVVITKTFDEVNTLVKQSR